MIPRTTAHSHHECRSRKIGKKKKKMKEEKETKKRMRKLIITKNNELCRKKWLRERWSGGSCAGKIAEF